MKDPILEVNNLRVSFRTYNGKVQAVRGIDFKLFEGETLAIVGEFRKIRDHQGDLRDPSQKLHH